MNNRKIYLRYWITTRTKKEKLIWFKPPCSVSVPTNSITKSFNLLEKHFPKPHKLHKFLNGNNANVNYSSLLNFKNLINAQNKSKQEKPSAWNFRDRASLPWDGSCQHKHLAYSCKVSTPEIKQIHPHYFGLTGHTFKNRPYKHNIFSIVIKRESRKNRLISYAVKRKRRLTCILTEAF